MLKKIFFVGLLLAAVGGGVGYYLWNKPHASIGKPDITTTAVELAAAFGKDEDAATKKFMGDAAKTLIIQVSGKILEVKNDTSGISLSLDTGDPINGVSCVLDKFTKQPRTDYKVGEDVTLKGICTGKLSDVVIDRCVPSMGY
jgi:tRNA_anti-like